MSNARIVVIDRMIQHLTAVLERRRIEHRSAPRREMPRRWAEDAAIRQRRLRYELMLVPEDCTVEQLPF